MLSVIKYGIMYTSIQHTCTKEINENRDRLMADPCKERDDSMKLIYAIVRYDNEDEVINALTKKHYSVTKLATTGGFLKKGNTTLLIGTDAENVPDVIDLIKHECGKRQKITINMPYISGAAMMNCATMPMTVEVGGATIFVIDVEHFEKI